MKFFAVSFWISLKQKVSKATILVFALLIACILVVGVVTSKPQKESLLDFRVGVVYDYNDEFSKQVLSSLEKGVTLTHFDLNATSPEKLVKNLAHESFQVLYVFPKNLKERTATGRLEGAITGYSMPNNPLGSVIDKWVFASLVTQGAPYIATHQLSNTLQQPYADLEVYVKDSFDIYHENGNFVTADFSWMGSNAVSLPDSTLPSLWSRHILGMTSLLLYLWVYIALVKQIVEKNQVELSLRSTTRVIYRLSSFFSVFLSTCLLGGMVLVPMLSCYNKSLFTVHTLISLCGYALCLGGITSLLCQLFSTTEGLAPFGIIGFLFVLVFGGILFSPSEIAPVLVNIGKFFPSNYFIENVLSPSLRHLLPLMVGGTSCLALSLVCAYPHPKRR